MHKDKHFDHDHDDDEDNFLGTTLFTEYDLATYIEEI